MKQKFSILLLLFVLGLNVQSCKTEQSKSSESGQHPGLSDTAVAPDVQEQPERDIWQHPKYIIELLGDLRTKTIADLGAGSGYFSFKLLPEAAKVIAIDIDQRFIKFMEQKVKLLSPDLQKKFETRLGNPTDSKLQKDEVDAVLVVNTYIYIKDRVSYFSKIRNCMRNGGKLIIVDFKEIKLPVGPPESIKLPGYKIVEELKQAGFSNIVLDSNSLDYQYIVNASN